MFLLQFTRQPANTTNRRFLQNFGNRLKFPLRNPDGDGIINLGIVDPEIEGANVRSGIVIYINSREGELALMQVKSDNLIGVYTGTDDMCPLGAFCVEDERKCVLW